MSIPESPQPLPRKRPYFLRVMLILWMFFSAASACNYYSSLRGRGIAYTPLHHPAWAILPVSILALVDLVCVIALWKWKRWGMYGLIASGAVMFIITLIGLGVVDAVFSVSGIIIIGLLVRTVWSQFD